MSCIPNEASPWDVQKFRIALNTIALSDPDPHLRKLALTALFDLRHQRELIDTVGQMALREKDSKVMDTWSYVTSHFSGRIPVTRTQCNRLERAATIRPYATGDYYQALATICFASPVSRKKIEEVSISQQRPIEERLDATRAMPIFYERGQKKKSLRHLRALVKDRNEKVKQTARSTLDQILSDAASFENSPE